MNSRQLECPKCHAPAVSLSLFVTRRRHPVTCTACGTKLERVLPAPWYYSLSFVTAVVSELAVLPGLALILFRQWLWLAAVLSAMFLIILAVSAFLNARTRVEFADIRDARQDKPGRWYPRGLDE